MAQALASESLNEQNWDAQNFPNLDRFLHANWRSDYQESPYDLLQDKLRKAIGGLGTRLVGKTKTSARTAALVIFMIKPIVERSKRKDGKYYRRVLAEFYRIENEAGHWISDADKRHFTQDVRLLVAEKLLELAAAEGPVLSEQPEAPVARPIRRKQLEAKIKKTLDEAFEAQVPVVLWGESGNGKSTLARQLAADYSGRTAILREGGGAQSGFSQDVIDLLRAVGLATDGSTDARLARLRSALQEPGLLDLVVFDNVPEDLVRLVVVDPVVPVLILSRTLLAIKGGLSVKVEAFSTDEAIQAAATRLPNEPREQLQALCAEVGNRPIVIDLACRIVAEGPVSLAELCSSLARDPVRALMAAYELHGPYVSDAGAPIPTTVVQIYAELAAAIADDQPAAAVLETLLWITGPTLRSWLISLTVGLHPDLDIVTVKAGLAKLHRSGVTNEESRGLVLINDLTLALLRRHFTDRLGPLLARFWQECMQYEGGLIRQVAHDGSVTYSVRNPAADLDEAESCVRKVDITGPITKDDLFALYGEDLQSLRYSLWLLNTRRDRGAYTIGPHIELLWQDGTSWFGECKGGLQLALFTGESPNRFTIWRPNKPPIINAYELMPEMRDLWTVMYASCEHLEFTCPLLRVEDVGADFWIEDPDNRSHKFMTTYVPELIDARGSVLWTHCGRLVPAAEGSYAEACETCLENAGKPRPKGTLEAFARLLYAGNGSEEVDLRVHEALLAVVTTADELPTTLSAALGCLRRHESSLNPLYQDYQAAVYAYIAMNAARFAAEGGYVDLTSRAVTRLSELPVQILLARHLRDIDRYATLLQVAPALERVGEVEAARRAAALARFHLMKHNLRQLIIEYSADPVSNRAEVIMAKYDHWFHESPWRSSAVRYSIVRSKFGRSLYRRLGRWKLSRYVTATESSPAR